MFKEIFNICFFFYLSNYRCPSLRCIGKPHRSLWLNLCLKCTARLRDLTDNCMCRVQRWGSHSKIMLNTIIAHRVSPWSMWLKDIFTPELIYACHKKGDYYFSFSFFIHFSKLSENTIQLWQYRILCVGQWPGYFSQKHGCICQKAETARQ